MTRRWIVFCGDEVSWCCMAWTMDGNGEDWVVFGIGI